MYIEKFTPEEKEQLKKLCYDCKVYQTMESDAKKLKEQTKEQIKKILNKYGYNAKETIDIYKIEFQEQIKPQVDTEKLKACGLYEKFLKTEKVKPLTIR